MEFISDILYWISTGLLVPVIVALIGLFIYSLILVGGFFGQFMLIRRTSKSIREALTGLSMANIDAVASKLPQADNILVLKYVQSMIAQKESPAEVRRLLAEFEIESARDLSSSRTLSKLGPMLGLMGTLIPMGPALAGLASGDIESMARNMQVAFATTVTGLVAAVIGFVLMQVKQRWYQQDLANLDYLAEVILGEDK